MIGCWSRGAAKGLHGIIAGGCHELALAANSGTMVNGMLTILLDICSTITVIGLETAQTFEQ
eukprot:2177486-Pyramimonas_sp.AAC.1